MAKLILFNKPFRVLSQFTDQQADAQRSPTRATLADWITVPHVYPAGRLDYDSEGLLLLTDNGDLQHRIASPTQKMPKTYWVQVEGDITDAAISQLEKGVQLKDGMTSPAQVNRITPPQIWERVPPVRFRASVPTSWLQMTITEGRNRQVRRMTAAVSFPTLRLIRYQIGDWNINGMAPGEYKVTQVHLPETTPQRRRASPKNSMKSSRRWPKR
ncbi:pseudouridine synthase [Marinobacter salinisoli]|uniref:Pseudouridine synthase n=1 Tax=Marinobacter salinisoli TaxID=2769486 RepID=A0ABX7MQ42_9GAMM|nr:pseudouridine synthase [Marinobacter salinisoli]QSP93602.1 pseudouridine synthase [Marinobacter salinisoli]